MQTIEPIDEVGVLSNQLIMAHFQPKEKLVLSIKCSKYNEYSRKQERSFIITTKSIFNFDKNKKKRQIHLEDVVALSVNLGNQDEFVLHVRAQYDYRISSIDKRHLFIQKLLQVYCASYSQMAFFFAELPNLIEMTTLKSHLKYGRNRHPSKDPVYVDLPCWQRYLEKDTKEKNVNKNSFNQLYSKDLVQCTPWEFKVEHVLRKGSASMYIYLVKRKDRLYALKIVPWHHIYQINNIKEGQTDEQNKIIQQLLNYYPRKYMQQLHYCFSSNNSLYFFTKFYKNGDLYSQLRENKVLDESRARYFFCQLLVAVDGLHKEGLVYRDITPENILVDCNGMVALIDFGVGRLLHPETDSTGILQATPEYLAPEIIQRNAYQKQSDYWQLGVLLYEMLFGVPPFYCNDTEVMLDLILHQEVVFKEGHDVSGACMEVLQGLLQKNPRERLSDYDEVKQKQWITKEYMEQVERQNQNREWVPPSTTHFDTYLDEELLKKSTIDFYYQ